MNVPTRVRPHQGIPPKRSPRMRRQRRQVSDAIATDFLREGTPPPPTHTYIPPTHLRANANDTRTPPVHIDTNVTLPTVLLWCCGRGGATFLNLCRPSLFRRTPTATVTSLSRPCLFSITTFNYNPEHRVFFYSSPQLSPAQLGNGKGGVRWNQDMILGSTEPEYA